MKTLTKIKLINWHIFDNHTIEIKNNTLLTGENGHGKSTFLDAVNFVLSAASGKFNQAANINTKRNVESYIRGKTGIEGKAYLRDQDHIISHIALEFFDSFTSKYLTIGVVFELPFPQRKNFGTFYHISDSQLLDEYFLFDKEILGLNKFEQAILAKGKTIYISETRKEIKHMIKSTLGLTSDKYFELLPKALAFHPINEVNEFVYDFLLPEDRVDIESLQTNIHSYREISKLLNNEKQKIDLLLPLENLAYEYEKTKINKNVLDYLIVKLQFELTQQSIDSTEYDLKVTNQAKSKTEEIISISKSNLFFIEKDLNELQKSDISLRIDSLEKQLRNEEQELDHIESKIKEMIEIISNEHQVAKNAGIDFYVDKYLNTKGYDHIVAQIKNYDITIEKLRSSLEIDKLKQQSELHEIKKDKIEVSEDIERLQSNRFTYDLNVETLKNTLKEELADFFNKEIVEVKPLCEFLEIEPENEEWRNAIEGYMNTQRFDLIVEPHYFDKALEIYEKHKFNKNIHGVGLINTNKLNGYIMEPNSLASKVKGINEIARQAVYMVMGKVICVGNIQELKSHSQTITRSGMLYRNNTARQIRKSIWEKPFIGQKAIIKQLESAKSREKDINLKIHSCVFSINGIDSRLNTLKKSQVRELLNRPNYFAEKDGINSKITLIHEEITKHKNDNIWLEVAGLIEEKKREKLGIESQIEEQLKKVGSCETEIERYRELIRDANEKLTNLLLEMDRFPDVNRLHIQIEETRSKLLNRYNNNYEKVIQNIRYEIVSIGKALGNQENEIVSLMKDYTQKYDNGQLIPVINNLRDYLDVFYRIKGRNIVEYEDRAHKALIACEKSFKEDFLSKLREKFIHAQDSFKNLNKSLRTKPFGSDKEIYEFTFSSSKNPNFRDYYIILQGNEDYEMRSLLVESLSEKNIILLKTLFDTLTSEDRSETQVRRIEEYTDYRKYMDYDIKITNRKNETYFFSKVNKEKSGGETQTPFYVIIASSFQQLLESSRKNRSSACVVLFDEAFNNMDELRIEAMMEYYSELNIQLLIAVPPQRLVNIMPFVETTIGLVKSNHTVVVQKYNINKGE